MKIRTRLPVFTAPDGSIEPDRSGLPWEIGIGSRVHMPDEQCFEVTLDGPESLLAVAGITIATDPHSQAIRAGLRQSLERANTLADAIGRPDLIEPEADAIARLAQSLLSGGGLPEPPEPEEP